MDLPHHPDNLFLLKPKKGIDGKFLYYAIANAFNEGAFLSQSSGSVISALRITALRDTRILAGTPHRVPVETLASVSRYAEGQEKPGDILILRKGKNVGKPIFVE